MVDSVTLSYAFMGLVSISLVYFVWRMMKRNQAEFERDNTPAIAGEDELSGGAKDPSQFDEPDDEALEEMGDLLARSAESQGLEYEDS